MDKNEIIKILEGIRDERTKGANTARRVGNTLLSMLDFFLSANEDKLSSSSDDTAKGLITFVKGLISDNVASLNGGATFGPNGIFRFDKDGNLVVATVRSTDFSENLQKGFGIEKSSDKFTMYLSNLVVWGKAIFDELDIRKIYSVGGNVYMSGSSSKIHYVKEVRTAEKNGTLGDLIGWQCYILADDGTTATQNTWTKYDQAKCQTFNIQSGTYRGVENKFYWRLVTAVSASAEVIKDEEGNTLFEGKKFSWIILSATDCESPENDAPAAGDFIVLDGHRMFAADSEDAIYNDIGRTNVMMLETTGADTPRIVGYKGVTDFTHEEKDVFVISPSNVTISSSVFKFKAASGQDITIINDRGAYDKDAGYYYYDRVSYDNAYWTFIYNGDKQPVKDITPTEEAVSGIVYWRKDLSGGIKGDDAVSYSVQFSESTATISGVTTKILNVTFVKSVGLQISSGGLRDIGFGGTCAVYVDGVKSEGMTNQLMLGYTYLDIYNAFANEIKGKKSLSVELRDADGIVVASNIFFFAEKGDKGDKGVAYQVMITSDTGTVMINGSGQMTLNATLLCNSEDISDTISNSAWSWWRQSANVEDDAVWNTLHEGMGRTCLITRDDVERQAQFGCRVCISDSKTINSKQ